MRILWQICQDIQETNMEKKPLALVSNENEEWTDENIESVNNGLLSYSRKWNKEFINLNRTGNELVKDANSLNAQTANFNNYISHMYADLVGIINAIKYNGGKY